MWNRNLSEGERLVRTLMALILFMFSYQEHMPIIQAIAGYLVGGALCVTVVFGRCVVWKRLGWD